MDEPPAPSTPVSADRDGEERNHCRAGAIKDQRKCGGGRLFPYTRGEGALAGPGRPENGNVLHAPEKNRRSAGHNRTGSLFGFGVYVLSKEWARPFDLLPLHIVSDKVGDFSDGRPRTEDLSYSLPHEVRNIVLRDDAAPYGQYAFHSFFPEKLDYPRKKALWAPERQLRPTTSTSSWSALAAMLSGVCLVPV